MGLATKTLPDGSLSPTGFTRESGSEAPLTMPVKLEHAKYSIIDAEVHSYATRHCSSNILSVAVRVQSRHD